ncbi:DNA-3-methyladenine glycosylase family protein [Nocardia cyriacigeorgica]|uniref:DNA-3-methyladenine glycosylase family protein n=1 Tax=Nocardia cyriacigeorgica TaxID=135487 RepID=UPI0018931720|nr:DNA-3-methyladenine glycosylase 2 family protein [Nocardia cyriacigeorgica]MBF6092086.1 DNA-3-methyladenine glycosylase 2 family protein [Nocardia cyriacigeorgica]
MRDARVESEAGCPGSVRTVTSERPIDLAHTISPLRRGPGDPCYQLTRDGAHWLTARMPTGPVTYRLAQAGPCAVQARAWGTGADEFLDRLPWMLCLDEDVSGFAPEHPKIAEAHRRHPGLRMLRTGLVFEALVPAVLEQKVHTVSAHASWRRLVRQFGCLPPGPAPDGMRVAPDADGWCRIPSWTYHRANVGPQRAQTIVRAARVAESLERGTGLAPAAAAKLLRSVPGIGEWTVAEISQRAFGDADALSVGDFHLAAIVGWTLLGRPLDDAAMVEYLEPLRPHRYRSVRLLSISGQARKPKFGPRTPITDHSWH